MWGGGRGEALLCRVTRSFRECSGERLSIDRDPSVSGAFNLMARDEGWL